MVRADLFEELIFGHGFRVVVNMQALSFESAHSLHTDVLENKKAKALIFNRVKNSRLSNIQRVLAMYTREAVVYVGGSRGDRRGDYSCCTGNLDWRRHVVVVQKKEGMK